MISSADGIDLLGIELLMNRNRSYFEIYMV